MTTPPPLPTVGVVLLNWKRPELTVAAAEAVLADGYEGHMRLVVVDNGSDDGSVEFLRSRLEAAHVIAADRNRGFAGGVNLGLRWCIEQELDAVCILNNDAVPGPNCLDALVGALQRDAGIAAVGARVLNAGGDYVQAWGGGTLNLLSGREQVRTTAADLDYLTGTCMLLRCSALVSVGLFDERFFMYWEDADLSRRFLQAGWRLAVAEDAVVLHEGQMSVGRDSPAARCYYLRSLVLFFRKHVRYWPVPVILRLTQALIGRLLAQDAVGVGAVLTAARSSREAQS